MTEIEYKGLTILGGDRSYNVFDIHDILAGSYMAMLNKTDAVLKHRFRSIKAAKAAIDTVLD